MKRSIFLVFLLSLTALLLSCPSDRPDRSADDAGSPADQVRSDQIPEQDLPAGMSELEAKLGSLGFQIPREDLQAVDFTLQDLTGRQNSLSAFEGRVVLLNFWATWCGPCRAEVPSMEQLYRELQDQGFSIVAINSQEPVEQVTSFVQEMGMSFPVLLDSLGKVGATYGVRAIPTTYIIDPEGAILARMVGTRDWFDPQIVSLVKELTR
jgi:DsbE subfamily thiol:disulfide oxidoreductase